MKCGQIHHFGRIKMLFRTIPALALTGAVLLAGAPAAATAQTAAKPEAAPPITRTALKQRLDSEFQELDANKDGFLSKEEIQAAFSREVTDMQAKLREKQKQDFDKLDTNHDGKLTLDEYQAATSISANAAAVDARLEALDTNKDGKISAAEYQNRLLVRFDKLDKNKDGSLSASERMAAAPKQ
jgi:hypothetical protein